MQPRRTMMASEMPQDPASSVSTWPLFFAGTQEHDIDPSSGFAPPAHIEMLDINDDWTEEVVPGVEYDDDDAETLPGTSREFFSIGLHSSDSTVVPLSSESFPGMSSASTVMSFPNILTANPISAQGSDDSERINTFRMPGSWINIGPETTVNQPALQPTESTRTHYRRPRIEPAARFHLFTWINSVYHGRVRLEGKESLLIDIGAVGNLCGSNWVARMETLARSSGQGTTWKHLKAPISLEGVGENATMATRTAEVPISLADGTNGTFRSAVIETGQGQDLPALLGLETLTRLGAIICCSTRRLIIPGKGGYKLQLSPGSRVHQTETAPTGHMMLPCSCWNSKDGGAGTQKNASAISLITM